MRRAVYNLGEPERTKQSSEQSGSETTFVPPLVSGAFATPPSGHAPPIEFKLTKVERVCVCVRERVCACASVHV